MQYDLDQFLSQYEFTPSNIHLSNFLKQLFNDELEEEKSHLAQLRVPPGPDEIVDEPDEVISAIEAISEPTEHPNRPPADSKSLGLQLSAIELERLNAVARRHGLTVNALVRDVLSAFLKYQG